MDDLEQIENMIVKKMGLDAASIGHAAIENALSSRQATTGSHSLLEYRQQLENSPTEFDNLIEELVIPETWFFRDDYIFPQILEICKCNLANGKKTRILSLPCSTGEEVFSVAIHLDSHGIPADAIELVGTDISRVAISHAWHARYRNNSFRSKNADWLKSAYFTEVEEHHKLDDVILEQVNFMQSNILDVVSLGKLGRFDIILCRNLLIYFNKETRDKALRNLASLLETDGTLFFGHAESAAINCPTLMRRPESGACAYSLQPKTGDKQSSKLKDKTGKPRQPAQTTARLPFQDDKTPSTQPAKHTADLLQQARKLADTGSYEEAMDACKQHLDSNDTDAEAYHILGLIHTALNNDSLAIGYFKKAVYLDPDHAETLTHLSLLYGASGDRKAAEKFKARAERARKKGVAS